MQKAVYRDHANTILEYLTGLFTRLTSTNQKIDNLESSIASASQSVTNGKQLLSNKLGVDTSGGLPTFSLLNQKIDETRTAYYNAGVSAADARALPGTVNYDTGWNDGKTWADNRADSNSYNYKSGYEAGKSTAEQITNIFVTKQGEFNIVAGEKYPVTCIYTMNKNYWIMPCILATSVCTDKTVYIVSDNSILKSKTCSGAGSNDVHFDYRIFYKKIWYKIYSDDGTYIDRYYWTIGAPVWNTYDGYNTDYSNVPSGYMATIAPDSLAISGYKNYINALGGTCIVRASDGYYVVFDESFSCSVYTAN